MVNLRFDLISLSTTIIHMYSSGHASLETHLGTATGFFYKCKDGKDWLITNRHVVIKEDNQFYPDKLGIIVHNDPESPQGNREIEIKLYNEGIKLWQDFTRDGEQLDVAAIDITDLVDENTDVLWRYREYNLLPETREVDMCEDVLIVGYPVGFYDYKNNLPVVKSGTIASTFGIDFNDKPHFLVDSNLQPGTSGSPVLIRSEITTEYEVENPDNILPYRLVGINSGEYTPNGIHTGLNIVWYAEEFIQLLEEIET